MDGHIDGNDSGGEVDEPGASVGKDVEKCEDNCGDVLRWSLIWISLAVRYSNIFLFTHPAILTCINLPGPSL